MIQDATLRSAATEYVQAFHTFASAKFNDPNAASAAAHQYLTTAKQFSRSVEKVIRYWGHGPRPPADRAAPMESSADASASLGPAEPNLSPLPEDDADPPVGPPLHPSTPPFLPCPTAPAPKSTTCWCQFDKMQEPCYLIWWDPQSQVTCASNLLIALGAWLNSPACQP